MNLVSVTDIVNVNKQRFKQYSELVNNIHGNYIPSFYDGLATLTTAI